MYNSQGVADNSITREKTSYYTFYSNNNLAKRSDYIIGKTYNASGNLITGYNNTNFIKIEPNTKYFCPKQENPAWIVYWNDSKDFISGTTITTSFVTPINASYVTIAIYTKSLDSFYVSKTEADPLGCKVLDENLVINNGNILE